jgi:hypothetical protein
MDRFALTLRERLCVHTSSSGARLRERKPCPRLTHAGTKRVRAHRSTNTGDVLAVAFAR